MPKPLAKSPRKNRPQLKLEAAEAGLLPLDYMLRLLRDPRQDPLLRLDAAKAAAPYCHAKIPAQVTLTHQAGEQKPVNIYDLAKQVAFLFTLAQERPTLEILPSNSH